MNAKACVAAGALIALLIGGLGGYWIAARDGQPRLASPAGVGASAGDGAGAAQDGSRKVLYWYDPMYPQHRFDQPGKSPFMDMELVPKYADEEAVAGVVKIDPVLAQNLGMRTAEVAYQTLSADVDAVATVGFNEREVAVVQARTGGFVERVYARAPGDVIGAGAPLADVLVSEWAGAQEEYLAVKATGDQQLTAAARERLRLLGMTDAQIEAIDNGGRSRPVITIRTPIGGMIQELGVRAGMSVTPGMTLARVNGLRNVWLEAAVPEAQAGGLQQGRQVEATFAAYPGKVFKGRVAAVLPEANLETRTLRIRMELPNPRQLLRVGMFANVRIAGTAQQSLAVPSEAVIRTGRRTLVFVSDRPGQFRPVEVEVGREQDGRIAVLSGLDAGERVAVSGQFLIDSEASFQGLSARMAPADDGRPPEPAAGANAPGGHAHGVLHEGVAAVEDIAAGEITLSHGPIPTLDWPPMTMPFTLANPKLGEGVRKGDRVKFAFRDQDGEYVVERIEKAGEGR